MLTPLTPCTWPPLRRGGLFLGRLFGGGPGALPTALAVPFAHERGRDVSPLEVRALGAITVENLSRTRNESEIRSLAAREFLAPEFAQIGALRLGQQPRLVQCALLG